MYSNQGGADTEAEIELSLEDILKGASRTLEIGRGGSPRRVEVKIPAGVREGSRVRVPGEGEAGRGGQRGDLYLRVRMAPLMWFFRLGDDLQTTVTVPLTTAVLGGEASVPTLEGPVGIKIPAGSPAGRTFRLRGQGLPRLEAGGQRGDILALLAVDLPRELSKRERELFEELKSLGR
jgi:DnaJ-class molecular chaperone